MADAGNPLSPVCARCGSGDISRDALGDWDVDQQQWVLRTDLDGVFCHACDSEKRLAWLPLHVSRAGLLPRGQ